MNPLRAAPLLVALFCAMSSLTALAGDRLTATGGVTQIEGAGGGGLVPWALITGYSTQDQIGASAFATRVDTAGFRLHSAGVAAGIKDRAEISYAQQRFSLGDTVPSQQITQEVVGIKLKLTGDAVFDQDSSWPQIAAGIQAKRNRDYALVPKLLGAQSGNGTDFYLSGTKLFLAGFAGRNVLVNATLRATKANQFGILGFGGDRHNGYRLQTEIATALLVTDYLAVGAEYRQKPDNLTVFGEDDAWDFFVAWFIRKELSITAGYVDLGNIANKPKQHGLYLSMQGAF